MTKKEKEQIREISHILIGLVIADNRKQAKRLEKVMHEHPERFSEEFLKDAGFAQQETERLMAIRLQRLQK